MRTSQAGIDRIAKHEGFRADAYRDVAGNLTIGYGHLIKPGEEFPNPITREMALDLMRKDLSNAEDAVNELVTVPLTQNQFEALVSLVYNIGRGNFEESTLLSLLNDGLYEKAAGEFRKWKFSGGQVYAGLVRRRLEETELFLA